MCCNFNSSIFYHQFLQSLTICYGVLVSRKNRCPNPHWHTLNMTPSWHTAMIELYTLHMVLVWSTLILTGIGRYGCRYKYCYKNFGSKLWSAPWNVLAATHQSNVCVWWGGTLVPGYIKVHPLVIEKYSQQDIRQTDISDKNLSPFFGREKGSWKTLR